MAKQDDHAIERLDWDELEARLTSTRRDGAAASEQRRELIDYFGAEEFAALERLARESRSSREQRGAERLLGNIVLIPGIMGSNLSRFERGDEDLIWVHYLRLIKGDLSDLRLMPDGESAARTGLKISPTGLDKRTYARAALKLRARWNVLSFPYDWRKAIDDAAHSLARFLEKNLDSHPVHLLAHSMGGLVARAFIRLHQQQWDEIGARGGRLVMLGTPNYGSFTIAQVLTGVEKLLVLLSRFDLAHNLGEVLEITNTFPGSYLMLPAPEKLPASLQAIYDRDVWGAAPVSADHLERARRFHEEMRSPATIDPEHMIYIAGCNRRTLDSLEILSPGEFRYRETLAGDGRVPHALGLLEGVRTYYVDEAHGDLPRNDEVLQAVEEILQHGVTNALAERALPLRALTDTRWSRPIGDYEAGRQVEEFARRVERGEQTSADERRAAEQMLRDAAMGGEMARGREDGGAAELRRAHARQLRRGRPRLLIEVVHQDICKVKAPVIVAGQYQGIKPVHALGALDKALDDWISEANERGMIGGDLGNLFFIPARGAKIGAEMVLLAGMGEEGRFGEADLRYLMLNVTYGISALKVKHYATLLIGAGAGNLKVEEAVRGLVQGVSDALNRLQGNERIGKLTIVEIDYERCVEIHRELIAIKAQDATGVDLQIEEGPPKRNPALRARARSRKAEDEAGRNGFNPRLSITREGDIFRFSALTEHAVIPLREVEIQSFFPDQIAERLMESSSRREQERLGRLLTMTLLPEDFLGVLNQRGPLTLILDASTAGIPWEMGVFEEASGMSFLGTDLQLTRQFRTFLSPPPGIAPVVGRSLRVLIIADPAPEPELQLPGARREGREVARLLDNLRRRFGLEIEVVDRIGDAECDPVDILSLILDGGFDVIHYAGHGTFDEKNPARGGWVFGKEITLSAREIFRARRVPRLVVANACFSAVVNRGKKLTSENMNRQLAGIAEAFFARGVQNYIGAGWPVDDDLAAEFARTFYSHAIAGMDVGAAGEQAARRGKARASAGEKRGALVAKPKTLAEAMGAARRAIAHAGSTWGAYHHYGKAEDRIIDPEKAA